MGYTSVMHPSSGEAAKTCQVAKAALYTPCITWSMVTCTSPVHPVCHMPMRFDVRQMAMAALCTPYIPLSS